MTPSQMVELRNYIAADDALKQLGIDGKDQESADTINGRTEVVVQKPRMIGERGIMSALGIIEGPIFLTSLDAFAVAELAAEHPLLAYQPGIKRAVKWLYGEGLDASDDLTRQMLDALASAAVVKAASSSLVKAVAEKTISYPISVGWGQISANDIARAVRDDQGNSLLGA